MEHIINETNRRYLLNSFDNLFNKRKNAKMKLNEAFNMLLNVLDDNNIHNGNGSDKHVIRKKMYHFEAIKWKQIQKQ